MDSSADADGAVPLLICKRMKRVPLLLVHFGEPEVEAAEHKLCRVLITLLSSLILEAYLLLILLDFNDGV